MDKKKLLIVSLAACAAGFLIFNFVHRIEVSDSGDNGISPKNDTVASDKSKFKTNENTFNAGTSGKSLFDNNSKKTAKAKHDESVITADLYTDTPSSVMPLSVISELPSLPDNVRKVVTDISKTNNIFMLQKKHDKLLVISDCPENIRHGVAFTEISLSNGHQIKTTLGYNDKMKDSQNDIWEYDHETNQPVRHTKYNSDGDMEFVEVWNYDDENPVKYEMKDSDGKVISMRKETLNDGTDLRVEHLIYDKDGNTKINVSATYDGEDIKRFTYYNADKINESGSVFSEYADGLKVKETVYTSDLKVKNTYTSDYKDGNREDIVKWNNKNQEVKKYVTEENL